MEEKRGRDERVAGRSDEVKKGVNTVVAETRVTLDTALLSENVVVLALEVAHDLTETVLVSSSASPRLVEGKEGEDVRKLVVNLVSETGSVDDGEGNANAILLELCECAASIRIFEGREREYAPTLTGLILIPSSK